MECVCVSMFFFCSGETSGACLKYLMMCNGQCDLGIGKEEKIAMCSVAVRYTRFSEYRVTRFCFRWVFC